LKSEVLPTWNSLAILIPLFSFAARKFPP